MQPNPSSLGYQHQERQMRQHQCLLSRQRGNKYRHRSLDISLAHEIGQEITSSKKAEDWGWSNAVPGSLVRCPPHRIAISVPC